MVYATDNKIQKKYASRDLDDIKFYPAKYNATTRRMVFQNYIRGSIGLGKTTLLDYKQLSKLRSTDIIYSQSLSVEERLKHLEEGLNQIVKDVWTNIFDTVELGRLGKLSNDMYSDSVKMVRRIKNIK